jgi:hypothetical protein
LNGIQKVAGSSPAISTIFSDRCAVLNGTAVFLCAEAGPNAGIMRSLSSRFFDVTIGIQAYSDYIPSGIPYCGELR